MHDPLIVAFQLRRPWPRKRDRNGWRYWPILVTVWHREPGDRDAGEVCKHYRRVRGRDGSWQWKRNNAWIFHVHHWKIQILALQDLRRHLLTRCTWCGGQSRKGDRVDVSHQWGRPRSRWWRGEIGLYHRDCSSIATAHRACVCESPITQRDGYGSCARCGKYRAHGRTEDQRARMRELAEIPVGMRQAKERS